MHVPRWKHAVSVAVCALILAPIVSCKTAGIAKVYVSPDQSGSRTSRQVYYAGEPIFCVLQYSAGSANSTIRAYFQPIEIPIGTPVQYSRLLVADEATSVGNDITFAAQFPVPTLQQEYDQNGLPTAPEQDPPQSQGRFRCIVSIDENTDSQEVQAVDFLIKPAPTPVAAPNVPPGSCEPETITKCPDVPNPTANPDIIKCCTVVGACGYGPKGTGFCYDQLPVGTK